MLRFLSILIMFLTLSLIALSPVWAKDVPVSRISDDSQLRLRLSETWFIDPPVTVLARRTTLESLPTGEKVEIKATEGRQQIMVQVSRELSGQFPGWAQGSWMLTRRKDTGEGVQIRIFLRSDQFTYIDLRPMTNDKSAMDIVLYGGIIAKSIPIAVPFERLYTMQLNDIIKLAGNKFPQKYFDPDPAMYKDTRKFIEEVRKNMKGLRYENNDGAIDENGNYIFIETLKAQPSANTGHVNCSGFVKWLIDGSVRPVTGKRLSVEELKKPHGNRGSSFTENWENYTWIPPSEENNFKGQFAERPVSLAQRRDPYFGLDWIRNLAQEANKTLRSHTHSSIDEFEVRSETFSQVLVNQNRNFVVHDYPGFLSEAGYGIEGLNALLYTLAIDNPFSYYLSAVSNEIGAAVTASNPRGAPRLRQFYHLAALIPYFDEYGNFRVVVFESATESSFSGFTRRYPGHYINLVQIPIPSRFEP